MPAWSGGPCPGCGEDVPANVVRCRNCRHLLNSDLRPEVIRVPEFVPLPVLETVAELDFAGYFVPCPGCQKELRIHRKYLGQQVSCKHCHSSFCFEITNPLVKNLYVYADCPHCENELRFAPKYLGSKVACRSCNGHLKILADNEHQEAPPQPRANALQGLHR